GSLLDLHGDEGRTIAEGARVVLITRGLVNSHLLAQFSCHRQQAHAVGLLHAVAAALTYLLMDHQPRRWLLIFSAGALASFFGSALLIVDQRCNTRGLRQLRERGLKLGAVAHLCIGGEVGVVIALRPSARMIV